MDRYIDRQIDRRQINIYIGRQKERQVDRQIDIQIDRQVGRSIDRQVGRQIDRLNDGSVVFLVTFNKCISALLIISYYNPKTIQKLIERVFLVIIPARDLRVSTSDLEFEPLKFRTVCFIGLSWDVFVYRAVLFSPSSFGWGSAPPPRTGFPFPRFQKHYLFMINQKLSKNILN